MKPRDVAPELVKSNYIIDQLRRRFFDTPFEYYVDWSMARAFNGAILSDQQSVLQVLFFPPTHPIGVRGSHVVKLPDMIITAHPKADSALQLSFQAFDELIHQVEFDVSGLRIDHSSDIASQVARIHFRARCSSRVKNAPMACKEFVASIAKPVGGTLVFEPEHGDEWLSDDLPPEVVAALTNEVEREAEIVLEEPLSERIIIQRLRSALTTDLDGPILGEGQAFGATTRLLQEKGMTFLAVFGRHF
jgi:hypothetical protein